MKFAHLNKYSLGRAVLVALCTLLLAACASQPVYRQSTAPLKIVASVDLQKYLGTWYEIYRLPNWFEDQDCLIVTANYSLRDDGHIQVINRCQKQHSLKEAKGIAKVVPGSQNAQLRVSFFRPFYGDYWIIDLAPDYSWVLIGEPSGKFFWILARQAQLPQALENDLLARAAALGYQKKDLIKPANRISP